MKGYEIIRMEDRSAGMAEGKLFWVIYRAYKNKKWVESGHWISGKNEADCREKSITRFRKG